MKANGLGFSGKLLNPKQMVNQVQITLAIQITYFLLINSIKISILFFYLRIGKFPTFFAVGPQTKPYITATRKRFEILVKGTIYFLLTFGILCVILCLLQCIPLHKMWDFTGNAPGKCVNTTALFYSSLYVLSYFTKFLPLTTSKQHRQSTLQSIFGSSSFQSPPSSKSNALAATKQPLSGSSA